MKNIKTIDDFKNKYSLKNVDLDDLVLELHEYSQKNNWSEDTFKHRLRLLQKLHRPLFIQLNKWLISFGLPTEHTITKAKKSLEKNVFASIIDVKENNYYNYKTKESLVKYLDKNPHKRVNRKYAKDEGYRVFLETLR
tara:strand:- start:97 stop:510 length:414 start_codon:yes stop_codon:yes gene_type:complete